MWIAAHYNRKLTKTHVQGTDINISAKSILESDTPLALRLTGQLLLGLVRIYQRKVKYLQEDCSDALSKMKMIFRPGVVDLPVDATVAASNQITFTDNLEGLDYEIPEIPLDDLDMFIAGPTEVDVTISGSFSAPSVTITTKRSDRTVAKEEITLSQLESLEDIDMFAGEELLQELPADMEGPSIFGEESVEMGREGQLQPDAAALDDFDFDLRGIMLSSCSTLASVVSQPSLVFKMLQEVIKWGL